MLRLGVLPPAATPTTAVPDALSVPATTPVTPNLVDLDRLWRVPLPMAQTLAFLSAHPPLGMTCTGSGTSGGPGGVTSEELTFDLTSLPVGIQSAQLQAEVAPTGPSSSAVRVDAQVVFLPPRSAAEQVPPTDTVVVVTRSGFMPSGAPASARLTRTDPSNVGLLASILDRLPPAVPGMSSCPAESLQYQLAFAARLGAAPNYVATTTACDGVVVTIAGVAVQPVLSDAGGTLTQALEAMFAGSP